MALVRVSFDLDTKRFSAADAEKIIKAEILRAAMDQQRARFAEVRADTTIEDDRKSIKMAEHLIAIEWAVQAGSTLTVEEVPEMVS